MGFGLGAAPFFSNFYGAVTDLASVVTECEKDQEDIAAFELAQTLVPAGVAVMALGVIASIAALAVDNKIIAIVGGAVGLVALVTVQAAPVYAAIGGECELGEICYESGMANP